jgi:N-sulfoglucosamine sulfohydrolase
VWIAKSTPFGFGNPNGAFAEVINPQSKEFPMNQPNIIYIHSHDTGRYVQPYGHAIPTPNIQKLAETGVLFRQAFCANPTCSPSRAALLTGQWAHSCGMGGLANRGWSLPVPEHLLSHTLSRSGYVSVLAGFQHVVRDVNTAGYQRILSEESQKPTEARAADFLAETHTQPFFLDVAFGETHRRGDSFDPQPDGEPKTDPRYVKPPAPFPDTPVTRQDMAEYIDAARTLDQKMGRVFDALEANGLVDNTLVICTTDHGLAFPQMKCHLTDHGIGVMLIMHGPGGFEGGQVVDGLVSQIDLFPTVCELAGIDLPEWLQGTSVTPLVRGEADDIRDSIFAEVNYHCCYEPQRAIRTKRWKYIRRYDEAKRWALPNCDNSISKTFMIEHGWRDLPVESERLYDLVYDPHEAHNVVRDERYADVLQEMQRQLERWRQETDDPLLTDGVMMPPETAVVNDPDDLSPGAPHYPAREFFGL